MSDNPGAVLPGGVPWRQVTCVIAACSRCGTQPWDDHEGYTPHFGSAGQARRGLAADYEWRITAGPAGGEVWLCRSCAAREDCARLGHDVRMCPPARMADGSVLAATSWCKRCDAMLSGYVPRIPAPPGYPAPDSRVAWIRWDAWDGDQARRPGPVLAADCGADEAAARLLADMVRQFLAGGAQQRG